MSSPLADRRIWFVGIGGAGLSGYAVLAKAWGAEVGGWDRVETPYLEHVRRAGIEVTIADEPVVAPERWEVVVSTAYPAVEGRSRAEFLTELVSLQRAIVVGGAHGKGTTAAMIAFALDRLGLDPAYLLGADVPQLGGNARAGEGWLVVEGDESDRTVFGLRPEIAVVTNVDLDHHIAFASAAELEALFAEWLAVAPKSVRGWTLEPADVPLPGEHNRRNAATALAALDAAGVARAEAAPVLAEFRGAVRRFEERGEIGGVSVIDDYAHHPAEIEAAIAAARERGAERVVVLFQPHLYSRTLHLAHEFGRALATADAAVVTEIYKAREELIPGVTGKSIVDAAVAARPGLTVGWAPEVDDGARLVRALARSGDVILTLGAGDVDRAVPTLLEGRA